MTPGPFLRHQDETPIVNYFTGSVATQAIDASKANEYHSHTTTRYISQVESSIAGESKKIASLVPNPRCGHQTMQHQSSAKASKPAILDESGEAGSRHEPAVDDFRS